MPVEFLSDEQASRYGRFSGEPTREQLDGHFFLNERDLGLILERRGEQNRLGFGVQLGTVRFLGTFLPDPTDVPAVVAAYVARQLGIGDPGVLVAGYARRPNTFREHRREIRREYGYKDYSDPIERLALLRFLYARARLRPDGPTVLFDLATARLAERKVLLPGVTTLAREVARVRDRVGRRLWTTISRIPDAALRERLLALLAVPEGERSSALDRLRRGPTSVTAGGLVGALERLDELRALGVGGVDVSAVPPNRLDALARYGTAAKAQQLSQMREDRRVATLLATVRRLEAVATDDALEVLEALMKKTGSRVDGEGVRARVKSLPALDEAALALREALLVAIEGRHETVDGLLAAVFETVPKERILNAAEAVAGLARPAEAVKALDLTRRYSMARRFVPRLLSSLALGATPAGEPILRSWGALGRIEGRKRVRADEVPLGAVTGPWRKLVVSEDGTLNRPAYTLWAVGALCGALRRREVFAPGADRYSDPRARSLSGAAWEAQRKAVCDGLGLSPGPSVTLDALGNELDAAYRTVAEGLERNERLLVGPVEGKKGVRARLEEDEALKEPESLKLLRGQVEARLPKVDLPELLMEVDAWTGFASAFSHLGGARGHLEGLSKSVVAVLTAEAANVGFEPVLRASDLALTRSRLSYVDQNYVRAETIAAANARLVDHQATIPLARAWGGGRLASVDGMRFRVPVRTVNAAPRA